MICTRRPFLGILLVLSIAPACVAEEAAPLAQTIARLKAGEPVRIVCFGDSVTGLYYHTGGRRAYTEMLGIALEKAYPKAKLTLTNAGISGHTTVNGLARIENDVLAHKPTLVTVMFGLNDMTRVPLDQYRENLKTIIEQCRAAGAEVLLCTPNNVIDTPGRPTEKLLAYCEAIREVGRAERVPVCDCYGDLEALRGRDALAWRLVMSDEIHPNMDGHKRIAESLAKAITARSVSLADVGPPPTPLEKTLSLIKGGRPVKILAMPPLDEQIGAALKALAADAEPEIIPWPIAGKTLAEIEVDAKARVRALKPDLVLVAVPRTAKTDSQESLIRDFTWIMNWSLSFGRQEWDCVVVHPSVVDPEGAGREQDDLLRQLVAAQDLSLIDRRPDDRRSAQELVAAWLAEQGQPSKER